MKTKTLFLLLILSASCLVNIQAQWFDPATVSSNASSSSSSGVVNTGNDRRWFGLTNVTLNVNVWDGSSPGIGWDDNAGNTGTLGLYYSDAMDPDVCLVAETSSPYTIYAVVVYYSPGQKAYYYQPFRWSFTSYWLTAGSPQPFQSANCFGKTVNIDGDTYEHFAIVWDMLDASSGCSGNSDVWCVVGYVGPTLFTCANSPFKINDAANNQYGMMPDVALYDQTGTGAYERIVITYILTSGSTTNPGNLEVDDTRFIDLTTSPCSFTANLTRNFANFAPTYDYYYPRIASVNGGISSLAWTVVLEDNDGSSNWLIAGYTRLIGSPTVVGHIYNDGSEPNAPGGSSGIISTVPNLRPAVTYDDQDAKVFIGWTFDNSGGSFTTPNTPGASATAIFPIVLLCDANGDIVSSTLFWEVPLGMSGGEDMESIFIAGRYDRYYVLYTYYDLNAGDVYYKLVDPATSPLRKETTGPIEESLLLYPNPNNGKFTIEHQLPKGNCFLEIFNTLGEKVFSSDLKYQNQNISMIQLPSGIYHYQIKNENETLNGKFIKQ